MGTSAIFTSLLVTSACTLSQLVCVLRLRFFGFTTSPAYQRANSVRFSGVNVASTDSNASMHIGSMSSRKAVVCLTVVAKKCLPEFAMVLLAYGVRLTEASDMSRGHRKSSTGSELEHPRLRKRARTYNMAPSIALLVHSAMVDLIASRLRDNGIDCVLAPPNGIRIECETQEAPTEDVYFPGMTDATSEKIVSALWGVSHAFLCELLLGFKAGVLPCLPMRMKEAGNLRLHYGRPSQMLYVQVSGPEPRCKEGQGGCWVLFRADEVDDETYRMEALDLEDDRLMAVANDILGEENID